MCSCSAASTSPTSRGSAPRPARRRTGRARRAAAPGRGGGRGERGRARRKRQTAERLIEGAGRWAAGPLGRWAAGPLGRWAAGPLGRWAAGPLGRWAAGLLYNSGGYDFSAFVKRFLPAPPAAGRVPGKVCACVCIVSSPVFMTEGARSTRRLRNGRCGARSFSGNYYILTVKSLIMSFSVIL